MSDKLTRREAGLLIAAASAVAAQNPQTPEDPAAAVTERRRESTAKLASFKLPLTTEPAFQFRP